MVLITGLGRSHSTQQVGGAGERPPSTPLLWPQLQSGYVAPNRTPEPSKPAKERATRGNFLDGVLQHFEESADRLDLSEAIRDRIIQPERITEVGFTVDMDGGEKRAFVFRRIVQSTALGPGKGGIRWAEGAGESMVAALAFEMPLKSSIYGLPLGGAKGGIDVDASSLSTGEAARLMRGSVRAAMDDVWRTDRALAFGPRTDVPAPDVGTSHPEINLMDLAVDEYLSWLVDHELEEADGFPVPVELGSVERNSDTTTPHLDRYLELFERGVIQDLGLIATFTGKSVKKGGSLGRTEATGLGVAYATLEMLKRDGVVPAEAKSFSGQTVAVQGFGNVGLGAITAFTELGAKVVAIREFDGSPYALHRADGFNRATIDRMVEYKKEHGTLRGFPGADPMPPESFWKLRVDVLAPCARENEITALVATKLGARYVAEGANGPTTADADEILERRGVTVLPDIFANAAGVIVSGFEMQQNTRGERWSLDRVKGELRSQMSRAFAQLVEAEEAAGVGFRDAAFDRAVLNIAAAHEDRPPPI